MKEIDKLVEYLKTVNPYLLSGGSGALATALAVSRIKKDPKKSRLADLGKKLAITLGGGLTAAGAHMALNEALKNFDTALPKGDIDTTEKMVTSGGKTLGALTHPTTLRTLAGTAAGAKLYSSAAKKDQKLIKELIPSITGNATDTLKTRLAGQSGTNKLKEFISQTVENEGTPTTKALDNKISNLENKLSKATVPAEKAKIRAELDAAKNSIPTVVDRSKKELEKELKRAGFNTSQYDPGVKASIGKSIYGPKLSRILGRSTAGKIFKPLAIGSAVFSPEIIEKITDILGSPEEENKK